MPLVRALLLGRVSLGIPCCLLGLSTIRVDSASNGSLFSATDQGDDFGMSRNGMIFPSSWVWDTSCASIGSPRMRVEGGVATRLFRQINVASSSLTRAAWIAPEFDRRGIVKLGFYSSLPKDLGWTRLCSRTRTNLQARSIVQLHIRRL